MSNDYKNSRKQQKQTIIIIAIIFIIALSISIISSVVTKHQSELTTTESQTQQTVAEQTLSSPDETDVTGDSGENNTLIPATVISVIDGKTLEVKMSDKTVKVQMIGLEITSEQEPKTKQYLEDKFSTNKNIWLQYDEQTNNEDCELCYVWSSDKVNVTSVTDVKRKMLQTELIRKDLAVYAAEYPNSRYDYEMRTVKDTAQEYNYDE